MRSDICNMLGIEYPIFLGGMTLICDAKLVSAVSNAGGMGIFATGDKAQKGGLDRIREELKLIKSMTNRPFGVNVAMFSPIAQEIIDLVCEEKVALITTGGGSPAPYMEQLKAAGVKVAPVVPSIEAARKLEACGADIIIAEGTESGGFIGKISTMVLVAQVTEAVKVPVVAAGGFADGRGMAAAFALGASGIQMGTRFMVCSDSDLPAIYKEAIMQSRAQDAVVEGANMQKAVPHRSIKTPAAEEIISYELKPEANVEKFRAMFDAGRVEVTGNLEKAVLGMGQVAGLIDKEMSAAEIIDQTMKEFRATCKELGSL